MNNEIFLLFGCGLFLMMVGVYMLVLYHNLLRLIIGIEIIAKGITLLILAAGIYRQDIGYIQSLLVTFIIVETVLAAVMLALAVSVHRIYGSLDIRHLSKLRG
jgi:multisubunit Na+/H+ antiporter MnhC subunit